MIRILSATLISLIFFACSQSSLPNFTKYTDDQKKLFETIQFPGFDKNQIKIVKINNSLSVLFADGPVVGGNILVSIGDNGVVIVDDQYPQYHQKVLKAIQELGGEQVDYVINTHWHYDHAEGNRAFGPLGAEIIAHENSRKFMMKDNLVNLVILKYPQQAFEKEALPNITFNDSIDLFLNNERIKVMNFGPAHTTGDAFVYFSKSNVLHTGDIINLSGDFVFIDADNGGSINGMINSINEILKVIDNETIIVPGHGELSDKKTVEIYLEKLTIVRDRIASLIYKGISLEEVLEINPAKEFEDVLGSNSLILVNRAYTSLIN
jgi:glyoxylase-like metal-dependent hydrolase (beta-lactamase superfamily II)